MEGFFGVGEIDVDVVSGRKRGDWCESFPLGRRDGGGWLWLSRDVSGSVKYILVCLVQIGWAGGE